MATAPTPEEVAREILARFKETNARPGHALPGNNIVAIQVKNGFAGDEMNQGLQYAGDQGWIENSQNGGIRLTAAGFAQTGLSIPTPKEVARAILNRFKETNARPGHALPGNNIVGIQMKNGFTGDEMNQGLQYAGDQGWIENSASGGIKLTDAGFAAM